MRGAQSPESSRSRSRERRVYVLRRIIVILAVLLLAALLVPRACQAIIGSGDDPGSGGEQGSGTAEKAAGAGGGENGSQDGDENASEDSDSEASDSEDSDSEDSGSEKADEGADGEGSDTAADEADEDEGDEREEEKDLGEVLTETVAARVAQPEGAGEDDTATDIGSSTDGVSPPLEVSNDDESQPAPVGESASSGQGSPPVARRAKEGRRGAGAPGEVAERPASDSSGVRPVLRPRPDRFSQPSIDPVRAPSPERADVAIAVAPVVAPAAAPAAAAPVQPAPTVNTGFAGGAPAATNFGGGGVVDVRANNAGGFRGGIGGGFGGNVGGAFRGGAAMAGSLP